MNYWIVGLVGISICIIVTSVIVSIVALVRTVMPEEDRVNDG